jgi:hypothetical protein
MNAATTPQPSGAAAEFRQEGERLVEIGRQMIARAVFLEAGTCVPNADRFQAVANAKSAYDERRRRLQYLPGELLGEPAWDMLLDLFIRTCTGQRTSVTAACIGSGAPVTTGLRYVDQLTREGFIQRHTDRADARRSWLTLSASTVETMTRYLLGAENRSQDDNDIQPVR